MGLPLPSMRLILREHRRDPLRGRLLTLGRMAVLAPLDRIVELFHEEAVEPRALNNSHDRYTNIPSMQRSSGPESSFAGDRAFFALLGIDQVESIDISDYEGAEHRVDLNRPVPRSLLERFDTILDFGTSEHIFDVRQNLENISRMLRPEGRVLHLVPATNRIGHGFYMFSPTLFYDYYWANQFVDAEAYLIESGSGDPSFVPWNLYRYPYDSDHRLATSFKSSGGVGVFFRARKTSESTAGVVPQQGQFKTSRNHRPKAAPADSTTSISEGGLEYLGKI